jgi:protein-L-isoaspartate(D-aspartate) O-methyltransferase
MKRRSIKRIRAGGYAFLAGALAAALVLLLSLPGARGGGTESAPASDSPATAAEPRYEAPAATPPAKADAVPERKPPKWDRPRFPERKSERLAMVRIQILRRGVKKRAVLDAMRHVPRHRFVPQSLQKRAYSDRPLPIGHGQTISQPYIVAFMTELLELKAGDKVLEIGTGSGYQAAVLSELTPYVYTIEILRALAKQVKPRLAKLGYKTIQTKRADGYYGWKEHAPFDAIIVTAAAGHVPPPLVQQLKPGGKMVIPVGGVSEVQHLVVVSKDKEGGISSRSVLPVRFVPMTGRAQKAD